MKTGKTEMDIRESAENLLMACMDVKEGEQVLVVADQDKYDLGYQVYETALCMNCEALFMCMKNRSVSGEEPPAAIAAAMCASDVVILSLIHILFTLFHNRGLLPWHTETPSFVGYFCIV